MKETIVLIHGYGFDKRIWSPVELAFDRFDVIALSLPGFGDRTVEEPYSIDALAHRFWLDLAFLKDVRIHLVGHSMGGYVCMEMVAQRPEAVASLGLIHSHVFADAEDKKAARFRSVEAIKKNGREELARKMIPSFLGDSEAEKRTVEKLIDRGISYNDDAWALGMEAMAHRSDHAETLRQLDMPVLMIMGEKDEAVPVEMAYRQAGISNRCKLIIYPDSRHLAMYDNTTQMIGDLISFYDSE
jgi:pimeloyl-ACP methyl ester carboxylesterase